MQSLGNHHFLFICFFCTGGLIIKALLAFVLPGNAFMVIIVTSAVAVNATQQREALLPH